MASGRTETRSMGLAEEDENRTRGEFRRTRSRCAGVEGA